MTDIAEYERRIATALDRIGLRAEALLQSASQAASQVAQGADDALTVPPAQDPASDPVSLIATEAALEAARAEAEALRAALAAERETNAQLSDRVRAIREKQENTLSAMERRLADATRAADIAAVDVARLGRLNQDLVAANQGLITNAGGVEQIDAALRAEVETLRLARTLEGAELDQILTALTPILASHQKPEARQDG